MAQAREDHLLAIDLGTSGPKVALFTVSGALVGSDVATVPLHLGPDGSAEQSPEDWWTAICTASRRLCDAHPDAAARVVGVACTAQWSGTVPVDHAGRPLGNAILWMDTRGAPYVRRVAGGFPSVLGYGARKLLSWVRLTGGAPGFSGKDSLAHILFLRQERREVFDRASTFLEPKDYLNLKLTGRRAATFDSIALHWVTDNRKPNEVAYHPRLLSMVGLPREKLPDLVRATDVLGLLRPEAAQALGVPETAQVVASAPDVHTAAVGSGAVADYVPHLYLGTSSWLTCHVPFKKTDALHNMATIVSAIPGRYLIGNEQECAGASLVFLRDNLLFPRDALSDVAPPADVFARLEALLVTSPPGAGRVLFTPWLYGERTPVEDPTIRGGFHNVSLRTTRADLVRAVYEGVAFNARWLLSAVEGFTKRQVEAIHVVGGGARSEAWCQIHADVLNRPVRRVEQPLQTNTRGAALIAAVGLGRASFDDVPGRVPVAQVLEPNSAHRQVYDDLFAEFVRLYKAHQPIHARLNRTGVRGH
jgi:xylulokinase